MKHALYSTYIFHTNSFVLSLYNYSLKSDDKKFNLIVKLQYSFIHKLDLLEEVQHQRDFGLNFWKMYWQVGRGQSLNKGR